MLHRYEDGLRKQVPLEHLGGAGNEDGGFQSDFKV